MRLLLVSLMVTLLPVIGSAAASSSCRKLRRAAQGSCRSLIGREAVGEQGARCRRAIRRFRKSCVEKRIRCKKIYLPVCGLPPLQCSGGSGCTVVQAEPQLYSNDCVLGAAGARRVRRSRCEEASGPNST